MSKVRVRTARRRKQTAGGSVPDRRAAKSMTAPNDTPTGGKNMATGTDRRLTLETVDGDLAAIVTITGMGHDASPVIVEHVAEAIHREFGHIMRDDE